jgi:hypothetical protein
MLLRVRERIGDIDALSDRATLRRPAPGALLCVAASHAIEPATGRRGALSGEAVRDADGPFRQTFGAYCPRVDAMGGRTHPNAHIPLCRQRAVVRPSRYCSAIAETTIRRTSA